MKEKKLSQCPGNPPTFGNLTKTGPGLGATSSSGVAANGINTVEEVFTLTLKESIDPSDPAITTVWEYNIPALSAN